MELVHRPGDAQERQGVLPIAVLVYAQERQGVLPIAVQERQGVLPIAVRQGVLPVAVRQGVLPIAVLVSSFSRFRSDIYKNGLH